MRTSIRAQIDAFAQGQSASFLLWERREQSASTNRLIGTATLSQIVRGPFQACYIGYGIAKAHEGHGLMHEALRAVLSYAFNDLALHRVMANHVPDNARSARLLARLGFQPEGLAKSYLFLNGGWRDHVLTSLLASDFSVEAERNKS